MAPSMPSAAASAVPIGVKPEEVFGAMTILTSKFKSAEEAATRIARLTSELGKDEGIKKQIQDKGLNATISGMSKASLESAVGESLEAKQGLDAFVASLKEIVVATADAKRAIDETGGVKDALRTQLEITRKYDAMSGGLQPARAGAIAATEAANVAQEQMAPDAFRRQRAFDISRGTALARGENFIQTGLGKFAAQVADWTSTTTQLERSAATEAYRDRIKRETGSGIEAYGAAERFSRSATSDEVNAELTRAAADLSAAANQLKQGVTEQTNAAKRQVTSKGEG
jgi:hypothetical protein